MTTPRCRQRRLLRMSGVNGGIDYDIDLASLPTDVAQRVQYVQAGPDSPTEFIDAARALAIASSKHHATLPVLVDMLGFNNPVAANIAVDALTAAGSAAIPSLLSGVAAFNYAVNAYALRALGRIGDPSVMDVCVQCAEKGPIPNVRRAACRALAGLRMERATLAERAHSVLIALAENEPDWGVRYAAIVALECFSSVSSLPSGERGRAIQVVGDIANLRHSGTSASAQKPAASDKIGESAAAGAERSAPATDPTVIARAVVALESMTRIPETVCSR